MRRSSRTRFSGPLFAVVIACTGPALIACNMGVRTAVSLRVVKHKNAPRDAAVIIDEEYIGPLGFVAARGVRLPEGEHRITIQKEGYFPFDKLVVAEREPIVLDVELVKIPD
jgi:hypothetical protein